MQGHLQFFMKEHDEAMKTYEEGLSHDKDNSELKEGLMRCQQAINKVSTHAGINSALVVRMEDIVAAASAVLQALRSMPSCACST